MPFFQGKAEFGSDYPAVRKWCHAPTKIAHSGDVLISVRAPVGPTNFANQICGIGRGLAAIRPRQATTSRWLRYWLLHTELELASQGTGTTFAAITGDVLRSHLCPIPPRHVQDQIVARIDALFSEIDEGVAALAEARAGVEVYRKALLKAAVTGELTADWRAANPSQETGEQLLARILADRRERWHADPKNARKRYVEPPGPDTDGLPELPEGWAWASLAQLSTHEVRNGLSVKDTTEPTEVRALRLGALSGNEVDWSVFRYLPRTLASVEGYRLQDGDLLVSRANGSPELVGKASLSIDPPENMIFPDTAIRFRLLGGAELRQWIVRVWNSLLVRHQIARLAKTTAGILKISQGDISCIAVPIPSSREMNNASHLIEEGLSMARHHDLIQQLAGSTYTLRQSILAAAFRGELVR